MSEERVVIRKVWRSELPRVVLIVLLMIIAPVLSRSFPGSVVTGELFTLFGTKVYLSLPLWWLLPAVLLLEAAWRVYNVRYVIDEEGIESWQGILSLRQNITHVRHDDVRSIETDQTVIERILDVGEVLIGTAATGDVEVVLQGVPSPKKLQNWLIVKRDKVQKRNAQLRRAGGDRTAAGRAADASEAQRSTGKAAGAGAGEAVRAADT